MVSNKIIETSKPKDVNPDKVLVLLGNQMYRCSVFGYQFYENVVYPAVYIDGVIYAIGLSGISIKNNVRFFDVDTRICKKIK
jgi:hypothetical protein